MYESLSRVKLTTGFMTDKSKIWTVYSIVLQKKLDSKHLTLKIEIVQLVSLRFTEDSFKCKIKIAVYRLDVH